MIYWNNMIFYIHVIVTYNKCWWFEICFWSVIMVSVARAPKKICKQFTRRTSSCGVRVKLLENCHIWNSFCISFPSRVTVVANSVVCQRLNYNINKLNWFEFTSSNCSGVKILCRSRFSLSWETCLCGCVEVCLLLPAQKVSCCLSPLPHHCCWDFQL